MYKKSAGSQTANALLYDTKPAIAGFVLKENSGITQ